MKVTKNGLGQVNIPEFILTKSNGERLGILQCTKKTYTKHFDSPDEITFTTYLEYDGEVNPYYEQIKNMQYIEATTIGRFVIIDVDEHTEDTNYAYKDVICKDISVLLGQRYLDTFTINYGTTESIDGVKFYSMADQEHSLLHLAVCELFPAWSFGHIDEELMTKERSFEVQKNDVYSFLMNDVAEAFECKFTFDTFNYLINAYANENVGENTNIHVSYNNLIKNTDISCSTDDIKTCMVLTGDDDLTIREIARGNDRIYNLEWFNSTEYWSQSLYDAYNAWIALTYNTTVNWTYLRDGLNDPDGNKYFIFNNDRDLDGNYVMNFTIMQSEYRNFLAVAAQTKQYVYTSGQDEKFSATTNGYADGEKWTKVIRVPNATRLTVHYKYRTESVSYDYAAIWAGEHPNYTAYDNGNSGIGGKLGGSTLTENTITVTGNTVTIAFRADGSQHAYQGFWAEIYDPDAVMEDNYNNFYSFLLAKYQKYYETLADWSSKFIPAGTNARYVGYGDFPVGYPNNVDNESEEVIHFDRYTTAELVSTLPSTGVETTLYMIENDGNYGLYRWYYNSTNAQYEWFNTNIWINDSSTPGLSIALAPLKEKLKSAENNQAVAMKAGYGSMEVDKIDPTAAEIAAQKKKYVTNYLPYVYTIEALKSAISRVEDKITLCNTCQERIGRGMEGIAYYTNMTTNFTTDQLKELSKFIRESDLNSSNYVVTDIMDDSERFEMLNQMLKYGENELAKVAQPQFKFSLNMLNIYAMPEFEKYVDDFDVGNYIFVTFRENYNVKATLTELYWNFYDPNDFTVTFGNVLRKTNNGVLSDIAAMAKEAHSVATSVSFNASYWTKSSKEANETSKAIDEGLLKAGYVLTDGTGTEMIMDQRGIFLNTNDINADGTPNAHPNDSIYLGGGRILFTDDDWKTVSTAVGRVDIRGESTFGVIAKAILAGYIEGSDIVGGSLRSANYSATSSGVYSTTGTYIDLENGTLKSPNFAIDSNGTAYFRGSGAGITSNTISGSAIKDGEITGAKIVDGQITETKIAGNAISTSKIQANAITANKIASNAITSDKIDANAITTDKLDANAVTANKIAASAITSDKITAGAITANKISTDAIKSTNFAWGSNGYSSTGTFLDLSNGAIASKNFQIDSSGNAYFKGYIEAQKGGKIGGFTIGSDNLWASTYYSKIYLNSEGSILMENAAADDYGFLELSKDHIQGQSGSIDLNGYVDNVVGTHINSNQIVFSTNEIGVACTDSGSSIIQGGTNVKYGLDKTVKGITSSSASATRWTLTFRGGLLVDYSSY